MVKYDTAKLKNDILVKTACDIAGISVSVNGFIRCPDHLKNMGKMDNKSTNCKIYPHSYICYACGAKGDIFSLVRGYKESYEGESISFQEAAALLAKGSGNEKDYILSSNGKDVKPSDPFPVSDDVLRFCGIIPNSVQEKVPMMMAFLKKDIPKNMEAVANISDDPTKSDDDLWIGYSFKGSYGIKNLYQDDPDTFWCIIYPKLVEGLDKLKDCKEVFSGKEYRTLLNGISGGINRYKEKYHLKDEGTDKKRKKQLLNSIF